MGLLHTAFEQLAQFLSQHVKVSKQLGPTASLNHQKLLTIFNNALDIPKSSFYTSVGTISISTQSRGKYNIWEMTIMQGRGQQGIMYMPYMGVGILILATLL